MAIDPTANKFHRPKWEKVDEILIVYNRVYGDGPCTPRQLIDGTAELKLFQRQFPREYRLAKRWFKSPNVRFAR